MEMQLLEVLYNNYLSLLYNHHGWLGIKKHISYSNPQACTPHRGSRIVLHRQHSAMWFFKWLDHQIAENQITCLRVQPLTCTPHRQSSIVLQVSFNNVVLQEAGSAETENDAHHTDIADSCYRWTLAMRFFNKRLDHRKVENQIISLSLKPSMCTLHRQSNALL